MTCWVLRLLGSNYPWHGDASPAVDGTRAMTQEPWATWLRRCRASSYGTPSCHMRQRIFSQRCPRQRSAAAEGRRRLMARLAALRGWNVGRRFAQGRRAVVTGHAPGRNPRVIKRGPRKRGRGLVTILARGGGRDMVRRFAHDPGIPAAMTGGAARRDPGVIHRGPRPEGRRRLMARLATGAVLIVAEAGMPSLRSALHVRAPDGI